MGVGNFISGLHDPAGEKEVNTAPSNVRKLILHKISLDAIPAGGGVDAGMRFLLDKERMAKSARDAEQWVKVALLALRQAADPNSWRDKTDEEIAGELLRQIDERKRQERQEKESK